MNKKNKNIANSIIKAQVASDGGKRTCTLYDYQIDNLGIYKKGYAVKDKYLLSAISKIIKTPYSEFHFYVKRSMVNNGSCFIVYFRFNLNGKRKQISFHSFCDDLNKYVSKSPQNKQRWDEKSSRETTEELYKSLL